MANKFRRLGDRPKAPFDGGQADNEKNKLVLPANSTTALAQITAEPGQIAYDTTQGAMVVSNGTSFSPSGGSGTVTNVATGTGLTGGPITTTGTVALANTAVTAGAYTNANITVDAQGRLTAAANGSTGSGSSGVAGIVDVSNGSGGFSSTTFSIGNGNATGSRLNLGGGGTNWIDGATGGGSTNGMQIHSSGGQIDINAPSSASIRFNNNNDGAGIPGSIVGSPLTLESGGGSLLLQADGGNVVEVFASGGHIPILQLDAQTSGHIQFTTPATVTSYSVSWPAAQGSTGQVLTNSDGAGTLTWTASASNIMAFTSSASVGGAASETLTVTGLLATDTILAVSQKTAGGAALPLLGWTTVANNALTVQWSADPSSGAVVVVSIKR